MGIEVRGRGSFILWWKCAPGSIPCHVHISSPRCCKDVDRRGELVVKLCDQSACQRVIPIDDGRARCWQSSKQRTQFCRQALDGTKILELCRADIGEHAY